MTRVIHGTSFVHMRQARAQAVTALSLSISDTDGRGLRSTK
jgi:hypothetical protein